MTLDRAGWESIERQPVEAEAYWRSLFFFNVYRVTVALVLFALAATFRQNLPFGARDTPLFLGAAGLYAAASVVFFAFIRTRRHFALQLSVLIAADVIFIALLVHASAGLSSGLGLLLLTSIAAAALISRGRFALFYAALASIAILLGHGYEVLAFDAPFGQFVQAGLLSSAYFATALVAYQLAKHTRLSEELAARREIDLQDLAQVNQHVIQDMPDGVLVVDGEGAIRQYNNRAEALLGSLRGRRDVRLADYCAPLAARLARWRAGAEEADAYGEVPIVRNLGARFVPVSRRRDGAALIFIEDLTRLQRQARQIKLAALGRLTANLAHEIRNPLGAISHAAELLEEDEPANDTAKRLLAIIRDNTLRLDRLVNEVLWLNRGDRPQREPLDAVDYVRRFVGEFASVEKIDGAMLRLEVRGGGRILFDPTHLDRVLWNLCRNAVRHSRRRPGSVVLRVGADEAGGAIRVEVIDDGPGVPGALRTRLFEPFFTTAPGGTGLGLYLAREVCEANGATLDYVESDGGAQFCVACRSG